MQKVLWRRGRGRTLLSKSHLIEFVESLDEHIPEAKFVDIVRHPKDSFVSWLALQQVGSCCVILLCVWVRMWVGAWVGGWVGVSLVRPCCVVCCV